jgi:hypothetical protein
MKTYGKKKLMGSGGAIQMLLNYCQENIFVDRRAAAFPMAACLAVAIGVADL